MERRREAERETRQSAAERSENSTVSLVKTGRAELMKNDVEAGRQGGRERARPTFDAERERERRGV